MKSLAFAARSLVRQPGRALVGVLGIAAVGALLFDMLLLSRGLVVSFRDLLDSVGYDVRVLATDAAAMGGPRLANASALAGELAALPEIDEAVPIGMVEGETSGSERRRPLSFALLGIGSGRRRPWTIVAGSDLGKRGAAGSDTVRPSVSASTRSADADADALVINPRLAELLHVGPGDAIDLRATCGSDRAALPPQRFRVAGVAEFPFDDAAQLTGAVTRESLARLCGGEADDADMLLVASREGYGSDAAVSAIRRRRPDLRPATNEEIVARMQQTGFSYFRQISAVLSTITLLFGFLLITVLLTVSVNQRLAEIAAVRALGFSRSRVAADVLWQSILLVGSGGALALPLGMTLSIWLDAILKKMPGIPASLHFFVFEPRALVMHAALLAITALLAAVYPMQLVATLPIATTLRNEVVS